MQAIKVRNGISFHQAYGERYRFAFKDLPMSEFEESLKRCVGFLYVPGKRVKGPTRVGVGTCFFMTITDGHRTGLDFLVTAKHVQEILLESGSAWVRINKKEFVGGESGVDYIPLSTNKGDWIYHDDRGVDLALLPFSPSETNIDVTFLSTGFHERYHALLNQANPPIEWPPREGDDVVFIAMMFQYTGRERNFPAVRYGKVALKTDETIKGRYGLSDYRVIDAQVYEGNSGAPVWALYHWTPQQMPSVGPQRLIRSPAMSPFLLGVLSGAWPEKNEIKRRNENGKIITEEYHSLGIAIVVPIEKVLEVFKQQRVKQMIDNEKLENEPEIVPLAASPVNTESDETITKNQFEKALKKASRKKNRSGSPSEPDRETT